MTNLRVSQQTDKNFLFSPSKGRKNVSRTPTLLGEQKNHAKNNENNSTNITGYKSCVYTDWIELTGHQTSLTNFSGGGVYRAEKQQVGTQQFSDRYLIYRKERKIATLEAVPRPSFINKALIRLRLDNSINYTEDAYKVVVDVLKQYSINFLHFTRIDYAIDFQDIPSFKDPQQFLQEISAGNVRMKGRNLKVFTDVSTGQETAFANQTLTVWRNTREVTGVTFGSHSSEIKTTIYNKTKELNGVKDKKYIREQWKAAGFDTARDVYRIEFAVRAKKSFPISDDGETLGDMRDITILNRTKEYAEYLVCTNQFYRMAPGKRISRIKPFRIVLRDAISAFKQFYSVFKAQGNNLKKSLIKHLTMEALFQQKDGKKLRAAASWELIKSIAARYNLVEWMYNVFEYSQIDVSGFTALDYFTAKELKDWKFSQGNFAQISLF